MSSSVRKTGDFPLVTDLTPFSFTVFFCFIAFSKLVKPAAIKVKLLAMCFLHTQTHFDVMMFPTKSGGQIQSASGETHCRSPAGA